MGHQKLTSIAIISEKSLVGKRANRFWRFTKRPSHAVLIDGALSISLNHHMSETMERLSVNGLAIDLEAIADDFRLAGISELNSALTDD